MSGSSVKVFISHKHHPDSRIASTLKEYLQSWSPEDTAVDVHVSSDQQGPSEIFGFLTSTIESDIKDSDLILLVYSEPFLDWSYCMWESGLSYNVDKNFEDQDRNIILLTTTGEVPPTWEGKLHFKLDEPNRVIEFAHNFLHGEPTFPKLEGRALAAELSKEEIDSKGLALYTALQDAIPKRPICDVRQKSHLIKLVTTKSVAAAEGIDKAEADEIVENLHVTGWSESGVRIDESVSALKLFGKDAREYDLTLEKLRSCWISAREEHGLDSNDDSWYKTLCVAIRGAIRNQTAPPISPIPDHNGDYYVPVILKTKHLRTIEGYSFSVSIAFIAISPDHAEEIKEQANKYLHNQSNSSDIEAVFRQLEKDSLKDLDESKKQQLMRIIKAVQNGDTEVWAKSRDEVLEYPGLLDELKVADFRNLGLAFWNEGNLDKAIEVSKLSCDIAEKKGSPKEKLSAQNSLAYYYTDAKSKAYRDDALNLAAVIQAGIDNGHGDPQTTPSYRDTIGYIKIVFGTSKEEVSEGFELCYKNKENVFVGRDLYNKHAAMAAERFYELMRDAEP